MHYIPYSRQYIDTHDIRTVVNVLKSPWLTQGPKIALFEQSIAHYCKSRYAIAISSATSALHCAYIVAEISQGDEVITTPNTFVATTNMMLACGAKPVFCDIRLDTYNIDETKIEALITNKTKAIVPVHFAGHPCDMDALYAIARKHKLTVIEDASHALGARYKGKKIGGLKSSDMTIFSFHPVKPITTGEGGIITTNNKSYYKKLLLLRSHGISKNKKGFNIMREFGFNYRLTDIQAALGISQLKKIDKFINKRRHIASWYETLLSSLEQKIILPKEIEGTTSGWHLYVIRATTSTNRNKLMRYLLKNNIGANFHYPAVYSHPYYQKHGFGLVNLKNEERYHSTCITLPLHPSLSYKQVEFISDTIKKFFALTK